MEKASEAEGTKEFTGLILGHSFVAMLAPIMFMPIRDILDNDLADQNTPAADPADQVDPPDDFPNKQHSKIEF